MPRVRAKFQCGAHLRFFSNVRCTAQKGTQVAFGVNFR
jgi:hypothetical protein